MRTRRSALASLATVLALTGILTLAGGALAAETTLSATLAGADAEIPPGDPDGSGTASIVIDPAAGTLCWDFSTTNVGAGTMSHIHAGAAGVAGDVVVPLDTDGFEESSEGCIEPMEDAAALQEILDSPADFYVNVHTDEFPGGAVRGQLAAAPGNTAVAGSSAAPMVALLGTILLIGAVALVAARRPVR
jgi:hypothetical protein